MGVLPGVGVAATVGGRVCVGITGALFVACTVTGVTVGNGLAVGVTAGFDGRAIGAQLKGSCICINGANRFIIPGGTSSGRKRAKTMVASASRKINPSKTD